MLLSLRFSPHTGFSIREALISHPILCRFQRSSFFFFSSRRNPRNNSFSTATSSFKETHEEKSPLSGLEDALLGYISGKKKATELAHMVWQRIARKGDHVVDATCGNGYDTLALLKMVADESGMGRVYGLDIQDCALKSTSSLLDASLEPNERRLVELFPLCHSKMEDIIPEGEFVRLIVFNLGYLPGGDKTIITVPEKTLQALQAACRILESGGLISLMVYVGHPGGREEYKTIQDFASGLPSENWVCCKFEMEFDKISESWFLKFYNPLFPKGKSPSSNKTRIAFAGHIPTFCRQAKDNMS